MIIPLMRLYLKYLPVALENKIHLKWNARIFFFIQILQWQKFRETIWESRNRSDINKQPFPNKKKRFVGKNFFLQIT